ncbi:DotH/IcmK family type IV secretion protein [Pantoea ananatis]
MARLFNGFRSANSIRRDPVPGSPDIDVKWIPGMSFMVITAKRDFVNTLVTVETEGLPVPLQISVMSGEADTAKKTWTVDARLDLRIPRRGPERGAGCAGSLAHRAARRRAAGVP